MVKKYVYALRCPIYKKVRYIGVTDKPTMRLCQHILEAHRAFTTSRTEETTIAKREWIKTLTNMCRLPELVLLTDGPVENWIELERRFYAISVCGGDELYQSTP